MAIEIDTLERWQNDAASLFLRTEGHIPTWRSQVGKLCREIQTSDADKELQHEAREVLRNLRRMDDAKRNHDRKQREGELIKSLSHLNEVLKTYIGVRHLSK